MPQVQLDDHVFKVAQRRAADAGYASIDQYVADVVVQDADTDDVEYIFTPQVLAQLDQISNDIKAGGKTYTLDEVREHFESKRKAWLAKHAG